LRITGKLPEKEVIGLFVRPRYIWCSFAHIWRYFAIFHEIWALFRNKTFKITQNRYKTVIYAKKRLYLANLPRKSLFRAIRKNRGLSHRYDRLVTLVVTHSLTRKQHCFASIDITRQPILSLVNTPFTETSTQHERGNLPSLIERANGSILLARNYIFGLHRLPVFGDEVVSGVGEGTHSTQGNHNPHAPDREDGLNGLVDGFVELVEIVSHAPTMA
jgi:hypothetical protein